jgi:hypothetical protein
LPHVRVTAAQAGGILWCLCKQELTNEILNGLLADVVYFRDMSNDSSHMLIYDTLSEHKIEILYSIYDIDAGAPFFLL